MQRQYLAKIFTYLLIGASGILTSCAGAYGDFYTKISTVSGQKNGVNRDPELIFQNQLPQSDTITKYGYSLLGYSVFTRTYNEDFTSSNNALIQGETVGADLVVLVPPRFIGTTMVSVEVPKTATINTTTKRNGTGTVYGEGAYWNVQEQSNSRSSSTVEYTEQQNIQVGIYQFGAVFLRNNKNQAVSHVEKNRHFVDARNGRTYRTVEIGPQNWMSENLDFATGNSWCYNNNAYTCNKYGRLYDWATATSVCPTEWHLPSEREWAKLEHNLDSLGMRFPIKLDEADSLGANVILGGARINDGSYNFVDQAAIFWSSSAASESAAWGRGQLISEKAATRYEFPKTNGFSVRCLKDN